MFAKASDAPRATAAAVPARARLDPTRAIPVARLLAPRSIAIVGVSPTPDAIGTIVLANLERFAYEGAVHLVSRGRSEVAGRACVGSIDELPAGIDVVVLGVPEEAVVASVEACARRGVGAVVVYAAGFGEAGDVGRAAQAHIAEVAIAHGMLLVGPNCLGFNNFVDGVPMTFGVTQRHRCDAPTLAVLAQSGGMMANLRLASAARGLPASYAISTGNEAVLGIEDYLDYLIDAPMASVIGLFVEQVRRPALFVSLLAKARRHGKPVVMLHTGRSAGSRAAAASHTGALAGDYAVMRAMVEAEGVVMVDTMEELADTCWLFARNADRIDALTGGAGIVTDSGAFKGFALDFCDSIGLELPTLAAATVAELERHLPAFSTASNPLDTTAQGMREAALYGNVVRALLDDPAIGCLLVCLLPGSPRSGLAKFRSIEPVLASAAKPVAYVMMGGDAPLADELVTGVGASGIPFFRSPERAMRALKHVVAYGRRPATRRARVAPIAPPRALRIEGHGTLPEYRGKAILAALGLPVPPGGLAHTVDQAIAVAMRIGWPVVLKAQAAALPHKSEAGGVAVDVRDDAALRTAWHRMHTRIAAARPGLVLDGVLVEAMAERGVEMAVGARRDPLWGPVLMIALGGVWIEVLGDARLVPADASLEAIAAAIRSLRGAALLDGARGTLPADVEALADAAARIGAAMAAEPRLIEIDVNPLVVYPRGRGVLALDALLVLEEPW